MVPTNEYVLQSVMHVQLLCRKVTAEPAHCLKKLHLPVCAGCVTAKGRYNVLAAQVYE